MNMTTNDRTKSEMKLLEDHWAEMAGIFWLRHAVQLFTLGWERDDFIKEWVILRRASYGGPGTMYYHGFSTWVGNVLRKQQ